MAARPVVSVYGANGAATGETINMPAVFKEMISIFFIIHSLEKTSILVNLQFWNHN